MLRHTLPLQLAHGTVALRYTAESWNVGPWLFKVWRAARPVQYSNGRVILRSQELSSHVFGWQESIGDYVAIEPQHRYPAILVTETPVSYLAGITVALTDTTTQSPNPYSDPFDMELWASGYMEGIARLTLIRQEIEESQVPA